MEIVCPHCQAINRVPEQRLTEHPKCGKCSQPLFTGEPKELGGQDFDRYVSRNGLPVVVDFWANWCGPCKMMAPAFRQAAGELTGRVLFAKVETEQQTTLAARYGIRSIPTMVLFRDGQETARMSGALDAAGIKRWLASHGV